MRNKILAASLIAAVAGAQNAVGGLAGAVEESYPRWVRGYGS